jgi:hypothetical protein
MGESKKCPFLDADCRREDCALSIIHKNTDGTLEFVGCAIALSGFEAHLNLLREGRWKPESRSSQID